MGAVRLRVRAVGAAIMSGVASPHIRRRRRWHKFEQASDGRPALDRYVIGCALTPGPALGYVSPEQYESSCRSQP